MWVEETWGKLVKLHWMKERSNPLLWAGIWLLIKHGEKSTCTKLLYVTYAANVLNIWFLLCLILSNLFLINEKIERCENTGVFWRPYKHISYTHTHTCTHILFNVEIIKYKVLLIYPSRKKKGKNIHKVRDFICIFKTVKEEDSTFKDCSQKMKEKSYYFDSWPYSWFRIWSKSCGSPITTIGAWIMSSEYNNKFL